jgi:hypothetical protein
MEGTMKEHLRKFKRLLRRFDSVEQDMCFWLGPVGFIIVVAARIEELQPEPIREGDHHG